MDSVQKACALELKVFTASWILLSNKKLNTNFYSIQNALAKKTKNLINTEMQNVIFYVNFRLGFKSWKLKYRHLSNQIQIE